ncbi:MAG: hypothetical protein EOO45_01135 [Flavobacterium sp.]|nr:MAG: hypothetical protein EOO45_01135 [Flavobacterium sp.]
MSQLIKAPEMVGELMRYLEQQAADGQQWVVYDVDNPISSQWDLHCFQDETEALDFEREYQQIWNWHMSFPIGELIAALEQIENTLKEKNMNRNSLESFREEARALKVPEKMIDAAEKLMEQNVPKIELQGQIPADKGMMDLTIHIKQSAQSDYYYFNKFDLAVSNAKPLEKDHQYLVISPNPEQTDKNLIRKFDSPVQAMDYFKGQKGTSELAIGKPTDKDLQYRDTVATMKEGKVDYVKKEFNRAFYSPVLKNSHFVDRGKGFSVDQAANMLQGRSSFREDMVNRAGEQYKAWSVYQFNEPKDRYGNYTMKQFSEGYGFDLKKELGNYTIKEMDQEATANKLITELERGNKPLVTVIGQDGEDKKLRIEAVPKYGNVNFFEPEGKSQKREEFLKEQHLDKGVDIGKSKAKDKSKDSGQEMSV